MRMTLRNASARAVGWLEEDAPGRALNAVARFQPHRRIADIPYGSGPRSLLDVYAPEPAGDAHPVIVFFYGGSWSSGAKELYRFLGASLAARGRLAIVADYSLYPDARFPTFLEDAAQAVRWTHDHAARFHGDPARLFVMGHSAGAHIAAMLALERRWLAGVGLSNTSDLAGMIGLAGPYRFEIDSELLRGVFGAQPPHEAALTQPLAHVTRAAPPLLLATGEADDIVQPRNTRELAAAVRSVGGEAKTIFYPRIGHREIVGAFSPLLRFLAPVVDDVSAFVSTMPSRADNTAAQGGGNERGLDERV